MKPEKILGKKFVRGKPYYKIKWEGSAKDQSSWVSPPSLMKYRSMIDKYEVKNWGLVLDEKFFDPAIYVNKGFANRSRAVSNKKQAKEAKRKEKKKIEEESGSSLGEEESSSEEESEKSVESKKRAESKKESVGIFKKRKGKK